jgi:hypothetical protein
MIKSHQDLQLVPGQQGNHELKPQMSWRNKNSAAPSTVDQKGGLAGSEQEGKEPKKK